MIKEAKENWLLQVLTVTTVYGIIIWFSLPPDERMYLSLKALQAYRRVVWARWVNRTPGWLLEALEVRGKI